MKRSHLYIYILGFTFSSSVFADFELGFKHYQNKEFAKAFKEFTYSASIGDKDAQKNIGVMYFRGEGVTQSTTLAYAWLKLANTPATPENTKIFNAIEKKLSPNELIRANQEFKNLEPYSNQVINEKFAPITTDNILSSDPKILKSVSPKFFDGKKKFPDLDLLEISLTVAKDGSTRDFFVLNKSPNFEHAAVVALRQSIYQPAQTNGQAINFYNIKIQYKFRKSGSQLKHDSTIQALKDQRAKADNGDPESMLVYGLQNDQYRLYLNGIKDENTIELENPNPWYYKSAMKGNATAAFILGSNQFSGKQCKQDISAGAAWLERAASQGSVDAQFMLGAYYFDGGLLPQDEEKGIYWLQKATLAGYANAAVKLARIYSSSPNDLWFKPQEAQLVFNTVKDNHLDQLSYYEVKAAVAAANGDFKSAIKAQNKAIDLANSYNLNLPVQAQAQKNYQQNLPWREL